MKSKNIFRLLVLMVLSAELMLLSGCQKFEEGFISPYMQYAVSEFSIVRGRFGSSYSMNLDGSTTPVKIRWVHVYDETGKVVDSMFSKKYPVAVWTDAYNPKIDTNYARIMVKRTVKNTEAIFVNESNGRLESNAGSINLPVGIYTMDIEVSNKVGIIVYPKMMRLIIKDGKTMETVPETGSYSVYRAPANTPSYTVINNLVNNPYVIEKMYRYADTPNMLTVKVLDQNGVVINPKKGEIVKRPNTGLNPNPAFLQNLQDYAPDTYIASDTTMIIRYPLAPFPIISLGNGFNMYYRIPAEFITIDSTSAWPTNTPGNYYTGETDSHYRGKHTNNVFDYSIRMPMRIQVPGAYRIELKFLNIKRK